MINPLGTLGRLGLGGAIIMYALIAIPDNFSMQGQDKSFSITNPVQTVQGQSGEIQKQGLDVVKRFMQQFREAIQESAGTARQNRQERQGNQTQQASQIIEPRRMRAETQTRQNQRTEIKAKAEGPVWVRDEWGGAVLEPFGVGIQDNRMRMNNDKADNYGR